VPPDIRVVQLGIGFSPARLQLGAGQQFVVSVSDDVQVTWTGIPNACPPSGQTTQLADGLLAVQCTASGSYLFTAEQPGSVTLMATVRPQCASGSVCPQWIAETSLAVTIVSDRS
jgi:hypothetical protein